MGQQLQPALSTLRAVLRHQFASPPLSISNSIENLNSDLPSNITTTTKRDNLKKLLIGERRRKGRKEWKIRLGKTVLKLSFLIGIPSLTWYSAVPLTSMTGSSSYSASKSVPKLMG